MTDLLCERASFVVGIDLATAHAYAAAAAARRASVAVADGSRLPFRAEVFDVVWSSNTVNHFADPVAVLRDLRSVLSPGGWLILGQSCLVPEMFFAWDYHFDARVRAACHAYYRSKLGLAEADTAASTRLVGLVRDAGFDVVRVRTHVVERTSPLNAFDRAWFLQLFQDYWGPKLRPFMSEADWQLLDDACNPQSRSVCVDRPDFHHIQTYTVVESRPVGL